MNTFEPRTLRKVRGRHVAPKKGGHPVVPRPPIVANWTPVIPFDNVFEPVTWDDSWLTADDRRAA